MAKEISFIYHPSTDREVDAEQVKRVQLIIATFLVKSVLKKAAE